MTILCPFNGKTDRIGIESGIEPTEETLIMLLCGVEALMHTKSNYKILRG
ncbi:Hypothetical protein BFF97_01763 [Corynebacterium pseudotuberculosis]|nr:Hypothetical protein BFF97_01763 [Corynebacterium pseudotuberculosis]